MTTIDPMDGAAGIDARSIDAPGPDVPLDVLGTDAPGTDVPGTDVPGTDVLSFDVLDTDVLDESALDGHTVDELSDYLDSGRSPVNFSIESSPGCQLALAALERLRTFTRGLLDEEARLEPEPSDDWMRRVMSRIAIEAHAGRDIPIASPEPDAHLVLTEGAVRGLVRAAGDVVDGAIVGRCTISGDVGVPGAPVAVHVDLSVRWGSRMPDVASRVRASIQRELAMHTELVVTAVDVTIQDVRYTPGPVPAMRTGVAS